MRKKRVSTFQRLAGGKLNRQARKKLEMQMSSSDQCAFNSCATGLTIVHPNAGGIDVGNESHFVAVPPDRDPKNALSNSCATGAGVRLLDGG